MVSRVSQRFETDLLALCLNIAVHCKVRFTTNDSEFKSRSVTTSLNHGQFKSRSVTASLNHVVSRPV